MDNELTETAPRDSAALAFDKLRREVTTLRLAIERLVDEPHKIVIPDYTDTLTKIAERTGSLAKSYAAMKDAPALATTPDEIAKQIATAGATARAGDQAELSRAIKAFNQSEKAISGALASARTAQEQDKRLKRVSLNCTIAGMVIWAIFPGIVIHAMPESWHMPERMAAWSIGGEKWEAGQHILQFADEERWRLNWPIDDESDKGKRALAACRTVAMSSAKSEGCRVILKPMREF